MFSPHGVADAELRRIHPAGSLEWSKGEQTPPVWLVVRFFAAQPRAGPRQR